MLKSVLFLSFIFLAFTVKVKASWSPSPHNNLPGLIGMEARDEYILAISSEKIYSAFYGVNKTIREFPFTGNAKAFVEGCTMIKILNHEKDFVRWVWARDEITNRNVVIKISLSSSLIISWQYFSDPGDKIKDVTTFEGILYAVGEDGLVIKMEHEYKKFFHPEKKDLLYCAATGYNGLLVGGQHSIDKMEFDEDSVNMIKSVDYNASLKGLYKRDNSFFTALTNAVTQISAEGDSVRSLITDNIDFKPVSTVFLGSRLFLLSDKGLLVSHAANPDYKFLLPDKNSLSDSIVLIGGTLNRIIAYTSSGRFIESRLVLLELKPFAGISHTVFCTKETSTFKTSYSSDYPCTWSVGEFTAAGNPLNYTFTETGFHKVRLIIRNGIVSDTSEIEVKVEDKPSRVLDFAVIDPVTCANDPAHITIKSSEIGKTYTLVSTLSKSYGKTQGTGTDILWETQALEKSDRFRIKIQFTGSFCSASTDSIFGIQVETPVARFYTDYINAYPWEQIRFYNRSEGATGYDWQFGQGSVPAGSPDTEPVVLYQTSGNKQIKLIAVSPSGCRDTAASEALQIHFPEEEEIECWDLHMRRVSGQDGDLRDMLLTSTGHFLLGGYNNQHILYSAGGKSFTSSSAGGYVACYNTNGNIRWQIKTGPKTFVVSLAEDKHKNIYINRYTSGNDTTRYTGGKKVIHEMDHEGLTDWKWGQHVVKTDKYGGYLSSVKLLHVVPLGFESDSEGNMILYGEKAYMADTTVYYGNGKKTSVPGYVNNNVDNWYVLKADAKGEFQWNITLKVANVKEVKTDQQGFLYITGEYEYSGKIFSKENKEIFSFDNQDASHIGTKGFLLKCSPAGEVLWIVKFLKDSKCNDMETDKEGNIYLAGYAQKILDIKSGGVAERYFVLGYFVVKISPQGKVIWANGSTSTTTGSATAIAIDSLGRMAVSVIFDGPGAEATGTQILSSEDENTKQLDYAVTKIYLIYYDTNGNLQGWDTGQRTSYWWSPQAIFAIYWAPDNSIIHASHTDPDPTFRGSAFIPFCNSVDGYYNNGMWGKMKASYNPVITKSLDISPAHFNDLKIFPNPTSDVLSFRSVPSDAFITLFDNTGKTVLQQYSENTDFNVNLREYNLAEGIYRISVRTNNFSYQKSVLYLK